jgi:hypothetical protein
VLEAVKEALEWVEENTEADADEFNDKRKEVSGRARGLGPHRVALLISIAPVSYLNPKLSTRVYISRHFAASSCSAALMTRLMGGRIYQSQS